MGRASSRNASLTMRPSRTPRRGALRVGRRPRRGRAAPAERPGRIATPFPGWSPRSRRRSGLGSRRQARAHGSGLPWTMPRMTACRGRWRSPPTTCAPAGVRFVQCAGCHARLVVADAGLTGSPAPAGAGASAGLCGASEESQRHPDGAGVPSSERRGPPHAGTVPYEGSTLHGRPARLSEAWEGSPGLGRRGGGPASDNGVFPLPEVEDDRLAARPPATGPRPPHRVPPVLLTRATLNVWLSLGRSGLSASRAQGMSNVPQELGGGSHHGWPPPRPCMRSGPVDRGRCRTNTVLGDVQPLSRRLLAECS